MDEGVKHCFKDLLSTVEKNYPKVKLNLSGMDAKTSFVIFTFHYNDNFIGHESIKKMPPKYKDLSNMGLLMNLNGGTGAQ
jgi:hypothetical protein